MRCKKGKKERDGKGEENKLGGGKKGREVEGRGEDGGEGQEAHN